MKLKFILKMEKMEKPAENLPWVEKYRPNALQEMIAHEDIIGTIRKFIQEDKLPHLVRFWLAAFIVYSARSPILVNFQV